MLLTMLLAAVLLAQEPATPTQTLEALSRSMNEARRTKIEKAKAKAEIDRLHAEQKLIEEQRAVATAEVERLRAEKALLEEQAKLAQPQQPATGHFTQADIDENLTRVANSRACAAVVAPILAGDAVQKVVIRYPDYLHYDEKIRQLAGMLAPMSYLTSEQFVETLYLVAKFSSFSGSEWTRQELAVALASGDSAKSKP
jgi:hypothetical protein